MDVGQRWAIQLVHEDTGREVPVDVRTVFGRHEAYYRYGGDDEDVDRLADVVDDLAAFNYVTIDSDRQVSRTHGFVDPDLPGLSDLNSKNGTHLNGNRLPTDYGRAGPMLLLSNGDRIGVGEQRFHVRMRSTSLNSICQKVARQRLAVIACGPGVVGRGERLRSFMADRKRFNAHLAKGLDALRTAAFGLRKVATDDTLSLFALCCEVEAESLILGPRERFPIGGFLRFFRGVPGRKVLVLEGRGDPTAFERRFADAACVDSLLITSPGPVDLSEPITNSMLTPVARGMRMSVSGEGRPGTYDDALDGLDALIAPDTNRLSTSWTRGYEGRLGLTFGTQEDEGSWVSHSLQFGSSRFRFGD